LSNPVARSKPAFQSQHNLLSWERTRRFDLGVEAAALRAEQLQSRAKCEPVNREAVLAEALRALDLAHSELEAARDQLREQADELLATRLEHELEWTRYRDLFEAAPLPYIETDLRGVVIEANRSLSALLKVPPGRLIGKPIIAFIALPDRREFRDALEAVITGHPSASIVVHVHPRGAIDTVATRLEITKVVPPGDRAETVRWMFARFDARVSPPVVGLELPSARVGPPTYVRRTPASGRRAGQCLRRTSIPRPRRAR
jgi:PAS domain S-box-containing protein